MRKEQYISPSAGFAKHSRNSDLGSKKKVNKHRRRKIKKEIKELKVEDRIGITKN